MLYGKFIGTQKKKTFIFLILTITFVEYYLFFDTIYIRLVGFRSTSSFTYLESSENKMKIDLVSKKCCPFFITICTVENGEGWKNIFHA